MCINLQIYLETSSPQQANMVPKLLGINYIAKKWALVMKLKALPSLHERFVVKITYDYLSKKHYTHSHTHQINAKSRGIGHFLGGP